MFRQTSGDTSLDLKALMLTVSDVPPMLNRAAERGYVKLSAVAIGIDPLQFSNALKQMGHCPRRPG